jgi:transcriptional regulator with XRE-family HTH domain
MAGRGPDAVDKLVGRNIRVLRLAKGLSQTELADALGVARLDHAECAATRPPTRSVIVRGSSTTCIGNFGNA